MPSDVEEIHNTYGRRRRRGRKQKRKQTKAIRTPLNASSSSKRFATRRRRRKGRNRNQKQTKAIQMGCAASQESLSDRNRSVAAANLEAMKRNQARGKDRLGHDKDFPHVTPNTPEETILQRQMEEHRATNVGFLGSAACAI